LSPQARSRRLARWLVVFLGILALILAIRGALGRLPHEPRLFLVNESLGAFDDQVIRSACGDVLLTPLAEGQGVRLELEPRAGCEYEIQRVTLAGDYLLHLIELGREQKMDVEIEVGIDYVDADLTTRYKLW
jgi:hypothetical protein